jgi:hypothetical protein
MLIWFVVQKVIDMRMWIRRTTHLVGELIPPLVGLNPRKGVCAKITITISHTAKKLMSENGGCRALTTCLSLDSKRI